MQVYDTARTRLTVREYKPDPVSDDVVHKLLEAGRLAPTSRNLQPAHFIVVRDPDTLRRIGSIASSGGFTANAPMAIAIAMENADRAELDAGRIVQQMELVGWELGLGTCFVGLRIKEQNDAVKALLGIPDHFVLVTVLPFGYRLDPNRGRLGRKNRKPLSQVAHAEQYGKPLAGN